MPRGLQQIKQEMRAAYEAGDKETAYAEWRALPPMKQAEFIRSGGQLSDTPSFSRN